MLRDVGVVCHGAGPKLWAHVIARLANDIEHRRALGRSAREYAVGRSWDRALAQLYQSYRDASRAMTHTSPVHHAA